MRQHDEAEEENVAQDERFAISLARLDGKIAVTPERTCATEFGHHSHSMATISAKTDGLGKQARTVVKLDLEQGWFFVDVDGSTIDTSDLGRTCAVTISADGEDEAENLARLLELAGASLRRQIAENRRAYFDQQSR